VRVYLLPLGSCRVDKGRVLTPGVGEGEWVDTPVWATLLETPRGWVLIDTGMHRVHLEDPGATFRGTGFEGLIEPRMSEEDLLINHLAGLGLDPEDISYVINTHLHFDHCGGNEMFPGAMFLVQRIEYEAARDFPEEYHARDYAAVSYRLLDGEYELCPGLRLIPTPGHTLGHQSPVLRHGRRAAVLAGDAIVLREVLSGVDGAWRDPIAGRASVQRLVRLAEEQQAQLLLGHDPEAWERLPHVPEAFWP
jgi:N-acyl homoserine lactone hydrolase